MIRTFVDTAVFLRARDDSPRVRPQRDAARAFLADPTRELVTSPLVLGQIYASLTGRTDGAERKAADASARKTIAVIEELATLALDRRVFAYTLELLGRRQMQLWDAVLWSSAILGECDEYASFDAPGKPTTVDGVAYMDPLQAYK